MHCGLVTQSELLVRSATGVREGPFGARSGVIALLNSSTLGTKLKENSGGQEFYLAWRDYSLTTNACLISRRDRRRDICQMTTVSPV